MEIPQISLIKIFIVLISIEGRRSLPTTGNPPPFGVTTFNHVVAN
jgi:hypothetical protein